MGITTMKRWTAMVTLVVLAVSATSLQAQRVKVLDYTSTYRYNQVDNLNTPANAWTARVYADTTGNWLGGPGLLAYEDNGAITPLIGTTLQQPSTLTPAAHAVYVRAHFNNTFGAKALLTLTNLIDDGAVFYLNGVQVQLVRAAANPVFTSFSSATATENTPDVFSFTATNLVNGDNVLAVAVLNANATSSDTVYGTIMWSEVIAQVAITTQPVSVTAAVNDVNVSFTVGASGTVPAYQWQFRATNNPTFANIPLATTATYTIPTVTANNAGFFRVIVSNPQNTVTSLVATLTVTPDISPPDLVSAVASETTNQIIVTFDENVLGPSVTNVNNYIITLVGGTNRLVVTNATPSGRTIRLIVTPMWTTGSNYVLTVNNVADSLGNVIIPNSKIGVSFWKNDVIPKVTTWNWVSEGFNLDSQNWKAYNYNEYTNDIDLVVGGQWYIWKPDYGPIGTTAFYYSIQYSGSYAANGADLNSALNIGWPTYYFRKRFVETNLTTQSKIRLHHFVDDGAVFYLNGAEILRVNMPAGPTTYNTLAVTQMSPVNNVRWTVVELQATNLVAGTNVIAVELHPQDIVEPDNEEGIIFQMSLDAALAPVVPAPTNAPRPDLFALASASPASVSTNENVTYTLTATNIGQALATNVQFTATFPSNITVLVVPTGCVNVVDTNGIKTLTCTTNTSVPTNQVFSKVVQAKVTGTNLGISVVRMTILQTPADKNYLNNTNSAAITIATNVVAAAPDVSVGASTLPAVVGTNSPISFSFSVTNLGATAATSVQAVDTLPPGVTVVLPLPAGCVNAAGTVTCTIGTMNAGTVQSRTIQVTSAATGTRTNRVVVSSTPADANTANNQAQSTVIVSANSLLVGVTPIGTTNLSLSWQSQLGVTYVMDYKPLLTTPAWTPVLTNIGTGGIITTNPPIPNPVSPTRFYRVRTQ